MDDLIEKSPTPVAAGSEAQKQCELPFDNNIPSVRFRYPNIETLPAIAFALMLQGRCVSTLSFTYGAELKATRLPAYILDLRRLGLGGAIIMRNLPLTPKQRLRKSSRPFAEYFLSPQIIIGLGDKAQEWAEKALLLNDINSKSFPFSKQWLELGGGNA